MSIFNKLQKALGFSYDDEPAESPLALDTQHRPEPALTTPTAMTQTTEHTDHRHADNRQQPRQPQPQPGHNNHPQADTSVIFTAVVELLDRELPEFYRTALNQEAQRKYLLEHMQADIQTLIANIEAAARQQVRQTADKERDKLRAIVADQKNHLAATQEKLTLETEKALSAERQKRAMNGRIQDLEAKAAALDAEKEQFQMEIMQLKNKLRLADTKLLYGEQHDPQAILNLQQEAKEARDRATRLNDQLEKTQQEKELLARQVKTLQAGDVDKEKLTQLVKELKKLLDELEEKNNNLERHNQTLKQENQALAKEIERHNAHTQTLQDEVQKLQQECKRLSEAEVKAEATTAPEAPQTTAPDTHDNGIFTFSDPATAQPHKPKKQRAPKKQHEPHDNFIDDTDWLADTQDYQNPDFIDTPPQNPKPGHDGPTQMSLF